MKPLRVTNVSGRGGWNAASPPAAAGLRRTRLPGPGQRRAREGGYVTLFVLCIAAAIFLALGAAMQANSCLRDANRRQARQLQTRAAEIAVRP